MGIKNKTEIGEIGRIIEVDAFRGIAILMMVVYHFIFDIYYFGITPINLDSIPLLLFQRATGSLFILLVGVSLTLSESRNKEGYAHHFKRGLMLAGVALVITIATWIFPHEGFITFGIIHFIAASTFIAPFFFRFGKLNVLFGVLLLIAGFFTNTLLTDNRFLFPLGLVYPGYTALDYYPLIPWFGMILIGISLGQTFFPNGSPKIKISRNKMTENLALLGKNSLAIYLTHQIVLVGITLAIKFFG